MKQPINFNLSEISDGGVQVKINRALKEVADNILDPNTEAKKKRKVQLTISISPNEKRDAAETKLVLIPQCFLVGTRRVKFTLTSLSLELRVKSTLILRLEKLKLILVKESMI